MNRGQSGQIRIRRKSSFMPIMLTSKSMKPVQRSGTDKNKYQPKILSSEDNQYFRRKTAQNCMIYSNAFAKAEFVRKMTQNYREGLMKSMIVAQTTDCNQHASKTFTASIVKVQFQAQDNSTKNQNRYDNILSSLALGDNRRQSAKKYFYYTHAKAYENAKNSVKKPSSPEKPNISFDIRQSRSKHMKRKRMHEKDDDTMNDSNSFEYFLKKNSLHIKKARGGIKPELIISKQKMQEISKRVADYQATLLKKLEENSKIIEAPQISENTNRCVSPSSPKKIKTIKKTDLMKIQEQITQKRSNVSKKQHFVFGMGDTSKANQASSKLRVQIYKDFLWKIAFSNGLYIRLKDQIQHPYKFYIGSGNNCLLIKGIMRRRFWWQIVDKPNSDTNFVWTQLKVNEFFSYQKSFPKNANNQKAIVILRARKVHSSLGHTQITKLSKSSSEEHKKIENNQLQDELQQNQATGCDKQKQEKDSGSIVVQQQDANSKIFVGDDYQLWYRNFQINRKFQQKMENYQQKRIKTMIRKKSLKYIEDSKNLKIQNHLQCNYFLGNKKALFYSLRKYYTFLDKNAFDYIPLTFHISKGIDDPQFTKFIEHYEQFQENKRKKVSQNIWIVKPGQNTNRGKGITVCSMLDDIKIRLKSRQRTKKNTPHTYIVQKYIEKPLLYCKRKFDIRHYMLMTCVNGQFKGYWYSQGYLRTTSFEYNIRNCKDLYTHLTNDAIQKNSADYGKFQKGNKVSYADFQKYLRTNYRNSPNSETDKYDFYNTILPKMKQLATDSMKATYMLLSPKRYEHNFQLFGLDFMLDQDMNLYLIQVNTNPCLQTSCPLLSKLISSLLENIFKICVDPYFPCPYQWPNQRKMQLGDNAFEENKFTLVFDENYDGKKIMKIYEQKKESEDKKKLAENIYDNIGDIDEEDVQYEDEGKEWVED